MLYWNLDGQKGKGVGIFGGATGCGAIFWTLVSLWLLTGTSLATALYAIAAIMFALALPVMRAVKSGLLNSPPTQAEFDSWTTRSMADAALSAGPVIAWRRAHLAHLLTRP